MLWPTGNEDTAGPSCFMTSWAFFSLEMGNESLILLRKALAVEDVREGSVITCSVLNSLALWLEQYPLPESQGLLRICPHLG